MTAAERKELARKAAKARWGDEEGRRRMSDPTLRGEATKRKWDNPEIRRRIIEGQRRYWEQNPEARKQRGKIARLALASLEVRHQ
jgi:hypothetical protein